MDTYYRLSSSAPFTRFVSVPLLCISSLDDPLCTPEAIPWDECRQVHKLYFTGPFRGVCVFIVLDIPELIMLSLCRANKNIVLATTKHGGHLAFFEGITASRLWYSSYVLLHN